MLVPNQNKYYKTKYFKFIKQNKSPLIFSFQKSKYLDTYHYKNVLLSDGHKTCFKRLKCYKILGEGLRSPFYWVIFQNPGKSYLNSSLLTLIFTALLGESVQPCTWVIYCTSKTLLLEWILFIFKLQTRRYKSITKLTKQIKFNICA